MARVTVLIIAAISVFLARNPDSSVFRIVSFAWAGFGATFGAVMLFALFWKRSNRNGALAGMIVGGSMVFIWKYGISTLGGAWGIYELHFGVKGRQRILEDHLHVLTVQPGFFFGKIREVFSMVKDLSAGRLVKRNDHADKG